MEYLLKHASGEWTLKKEKCIGIFNDDIAPIKNINCDQILTWMAHLDPEVFELEYFEDDCEICPVKPRGKKKLVPYLEGHFYVFTKSGEVVSTSIDPAFVSGSYETLLLKGTVDESYILSVILCPTCGYFQVSIEQLEM